VALLQVAHSALFLYFPNTCVRQIGVGGRRTGLGWAQEISLCRCPQSAAPVRMTSARKVFNTEKRPRATKGHGGCKWQISSNGCRT
jgi:hypothetical protein